MAKNLIYGISSSEDFQEIAQRLDIVSSLDIDIVHLPPFFPTEDEAVTDFMSIDPEFGTEDELKTLIKKANANNIKVYMELPITHVSIKHPWFKDHPEFFLRRRFPNENWENIDEGPAFMFDEELMEYYLQQFGEGTADLRWFIAGYLMETMVDNFKKIVNYWYWVVGVDGFYIPCPQTINLKVTDQNQQVSDFFFGHRAIEVIDKVFDWSEYPESTHRPGLIVEVDDPTIEVVELLYAEELEALVVNLETREHIEPLGLLELSDLEYYEGSVLRIEDRNTSRFPAEDRIKMLWGIFNTDAQNIYILEGQELGLDNPSPENLPFEKILKEDLHARRFYERETKSARNYQEREMIREITQKRSCANVRMKITKEEYEHQKKAFGSCFNTTKTATEKWRKDY